jgi:hypothetical protein
MKFKLFQSSVTCTDSVKDLGVFLNSKHMFHNDSAVDIVTGYGPDDRGVRV